MAKKESALDLANGLGEELHAIRLTPGSWLQGGTSGAESQLLAARKASAELVRAVGGKQPYDKIVEAYQGVVATIDTAGLTGLISEAELTDYYMLTDKIWAAIEQEK